MVARASVEDRSRLLTLLWSGKESALKALRAGLRLDTRSVTVSPADTVGPLSNLATWRPLDVRLTSGQVFHGWWQETGSFLRTFVAAPRPDEPILGRVPARAWA